MANARPTYHDRLGQKPTATVMPLSKAYEKDKKSSTHAARQASNLQNHINKRTRDRIDIAEARHCDILASMDADCDIQAYRLQAQSEALEATERGMQADVLAIVSPMEAEIRKQEAAVVDNNAARREAMEKVALSRQNALATAQGVEVQIASSQAESDYKISQSREHALSRLDELSQMREEMHRKQVRDGEARELVKQAVLQNLDSQSHAEVVRAEVARERAAIAEKLAKERGQAIELEATMRVSENESRAAQQVHQLGKNAHLMESQMDCILKDKMRDSALSLECAHETSQEMRRSLAAEYSQFKKRMRHIELDSASNTRTEERKILTLEAERLAAFREAQTAVGEREASLRTQRAECDATISELHRSLRKAEADTRQRAEQILAQWMAGSEAAEQAVKKLEVDGMKVMETMQRDVSSRLKAFMDQNLEAQQQGTAQCASLNDQATKVVDDTQPALEAARGNDEREAAAATAKWKAARLLPAEISQNADKDIESKNAQARQEEAELQRLAEERIAAAKLATQAAHDEERWLQAETSEAWSRIRRACFELRLINLHDFAQGIVAGEFDAEMLEILGTSADT